MPNAIEIERLLDRAYSLGMTLIELRLMVYLAGKEKHQSYIVDMMDDMGVPRMMVVRAAKQRPAIFKRVTLPAIVGTTRPVTLGIKLTGKGVALAKLLP